MSAVFERDGGYVVLDIYLKQKQGSQALIQHDGGTELTTMRGRVIMSRIRYILNLPNISANKKRKTIW
nr:MAG TPA_asm: hypothetical protein [Caudoviricetes sp.]